MTSPEFSAVPPALAGPPAFDAADPLRRHFLAGAGALTALSFGAPLRGIAQPCVSALHELGVRQAAQAINRREFSSVQLVEALLRRIEATESAIKAWEMIDAEGALAAARRCDQAAARGEGRALNGVPLGVKDIVDVAGLPTTCGWPSLVNRIAQKDAEVVARLRRAGALVLGKTVTAPFAASDPPKTRNPWNQERTPGGSSSGSGAAVASAQVPAALATQTGGSVLRPAAYCGAVGLKPTFGRVSRRGVFPLAWSLDHVGVIVRSVEDAALMLAVMVGFDAKDPGSIDTPVDDYLGSVDTPRSPRLGLITDVLDFATPPVRANLEEVAARLERAGARIRPIRLPMPFERMFATWGIVALPEQASVHREMFSRHPEEYPRNLRAAVEIGQLLPGDAYLHAQRLRRRLRREARASFEGLDCLLMPSVSNLAPDPSTTGDFRFQALWSLLGFPAIALPSGLSVERLPFSIQLVAAPWQEATLLRAARWCEMELGRLPLPV